MPESSTTGLRGRLLTFTGSVGSEDYRYEADGLILIRDGLIEAVGAATELLPRLPPGTVLDHYPDSLILPGLIDTHIHYPQTQVIASYGAQLLDWLQKYTFVEEQKYARPEHAEAGARFFLKNVSTDDLLKMKRTQGVYLELLFRPAVRDEYRREALTGLAKLDGKNELRVLLDAIRSHDDQAGSQDASVGYDLPPLLSMNDFNIWSEVEPPKGTVYNYPIRPWHESLESFTGYPAPPDIGAQIYSRAIHPAMWAKVQSGQSNQEVIAWAKNELEGFIR